MHLDEVSAWMAAHEEIALEVRWNNATWVVQSRSLCSHRPFRRADLDRFAEAGETPPAGDIIAITVGSLDEKDAILREAPPGFFTISHFDGHPAVLVALASARAADVVPLLERMRVHLLSLPKKKPSSRTKKPRGTT